MLAPIDPREMLLHTLPKNSIGAEIGVWKGDFSARLLGIAQPSRLYLIDPWIAAGGERKAAWYGESQQTQAGMDAIYQSVLARFQKPIAEQRVAVSRAPSQEAVPSLPDLDWIYIDGDHTFDAVASDLEMALGKVRKGGFICGDDYSVRGWWKDGVTLAVHEFLAKNPGRVRVHMLLQSQFMLSVI